MDGGSSGSVERTVWPLVVIETPASVSFVVIAGVGETKGIEVVEAGSIWRRMSSGTEAGVTFSIMVKDGRRRTVVG